MKNILTAKINFSFKGEMFSPEVNFDIYEYLQSHDSLDSIWMKIAKENNIGTYSYEFEVLESANVLFSSEDSYLNLFIDQNEFNVAAYKNDVEQKKMHADIATVLSEYGLSELDDKVKSAFVAVYELGFSSKKSFMYKKTD